MNSTEARRGIVAGIDGSPSAVDAACLGGQCRATARRIPSPGPRAARGRTRRHGGAGRGRTGSPASAPRPADRTRDRHRPAREGARRLLEVGAHDGVGSYRHQRDALDVRRLRRGAGNQPRTLPGRLVARRAADRAGPASRRRRCRRQRTRRGRGGTGVRVRLDPRRRSRRRACLVGAVERWGSPSRAASSTGRTTMRTSRRCSRRSSPGGATSSPTWR